MPNLYATPQEVFVRVRDMVQQANQPSFRPLMYRLLETISRYIDRHTGREFFPYAATRFVDVMESGRDWVYIPDLLSLTTLRYSEDDGDTYTALTASDYWLTVYGDRNSRRSYTEIVLNPNGDLGKWPKSRSAVEIAGVFGYADDRADAFENSQDTVENNPLTSAGTSVTVNDVDGADQYGFTPRFAVGQLLRIESEYSEITATADGANTLTVVRGRNGSTAAAHNQDVQIDIWRPPEPVKQAAIIQAVRQLERGLQGFGDARAQPELAQLFFLKALDPEALQLIQPYVRDV